MTDALRDGPRVLLVRLSSLGDVAATLPAAHAVRAAWPRAHLAWAVDPSSEALLRGNTALDEVLVFPRRAGWGAPRALSRFLSVLRSGRFEIAIDLHGNLRSGLVARLSGARRRVGYGAGLGREGNRFLLTETALPPPGALHRSDRMFAVLGALGIPRYDGPLWLPDDPAAAGEVETFLAARLPAGVPWVLLNPGASRKGDYKRWSPDRYVELAGRLRADGVAVVVHCGPDEGGLADRLSRALAALGDPAVVIPRGWRLDHLLALLRRTALLVSADTAPVVIADALGTPCVALYGPKDPAVYGPRRARVETLYARVPCSPCRNLRCAHRECLELIDLPSVYAAVDRLLRAPSRG